MRLIDPHTEFFSDWGKPVHFSDTFTYKFQECYSFWY